MGASGNTGRGRQDGSRRRRIFVMVAIGASFAVFVAGSLVFGYIFLLSIAQQSPQVAEQPSPRIAGVPVLPQPVATPTPRTTPLPAEPPPTSKGHINFLLLGLDQRNDERGAPTRSDTMMVFSVDQHNKRAAMISLPRDMWVEIPGFADNRINVANFLGDLNRYPGGGPALAMKTVEHNFGLKIDYYARIDFRGFERIVDTLGGVTVNVERAIYDEEYPTEDYGVMTLYIPAGVQHMDGEVALQYARSRHSENDFGRAKRQQRLMLAIRDRAMQLDVIPRLPSLIGILFDMVQTNIPPQEFLRLAVLSREVDAERVASLVIDEKLAPPFTGEGGAYLLMPNKAEIRKAIGTLLADPTIQEEAARIEVVNGTTTEGLAGRARDYLVEHGFEVVAVSNAEKKDQKSTQVLVMGDKKGTAKLLAESLRLDQRAVVNNSASTSLARAGGGPDIRIVLGQDFSLFR